MDWDTSSSAALSTVAAAMSLGGSTPRPCSCLLTRFRILPFSLNVDLYGNDLQVCFSSVFHVSFSSDQDLYFPSSVGFCLNSMIIESTSLWF